MDERTLCELGPRDAAAAPAGFAGVGGGRRPGALWLVGGGERRSFERTGAPARGRQPPLSALDDDGLVDLRVRQRDLQFATDRTGDLLSCVGSLCMREPASRS